ncbi:MAG: GFA family protein [Hyphomicrobium sp.]|uniref:GFA family protein n=1 Tax=Hyphomicrobium sp. TaxID=82 RepID=UPI0039E38428
MTVHATGSCLCQGVTFEVTGELHPILACHCSQCAKTSGNFAAMTRCAAADLKILNDETLRWYRSSELGRRGFCARCGGNLFWKQEGAADIYITAGTLDKPTGVKIAEHIFVGSKSDYYDITDGLPQKQEW